MAAQTSSLHLASLLDLSARVLESDPVDILNVAVLSIMGRLKIVRAAVLYPEAGHYVADRRLCKGMAPFTLPRIEVEHLTPVADLPSHLGLSEQGVEIIAPLMAHGQPIALLCLGKPVVEIADPESMWAYLELARTIVGTAVHNAQMVQTLRDAKKELEARNLMVTTLFETAKDFTGAKNFQELLRILSYRLMGQLMVSTFGIFVKQGVQEEPILYANRDEARPLGEVWSEVCSIDEPTIVMRLAEDDPIRVALESVGIAMVAPMTIHGFKRGALAICGKLNARPFSDEELAFLEAIANTAMTAIENERLVQEDAERARELEIAGDIQRKLLPERMPVLERIDLSALSQSSKQIGGDYFDVIEIDEHRLLFAIADVAGKGVPAALLMANVQAALNVLAWSDLPLTELVTRVNRLVCMNTEPEVFVTMFVGVIDTRTMGLEYVNAGHNPPIIIRGDEVILLSTGGVLTGVIPDPPPYQAGVGTMESGDILVLYTDGVTEARYESIEFGVGGLVDVVRRNRDLAASDLIDAIEQGVLDFSHKTAEQVDDDTSMLVIKIR